MQNQLVENDLIILKINSDGSTVTYLLIIIPAERLLDLN